MRITGRIPGIAVQFTVLHRCMWLSGFRRIIADGLLFPDVFGFFCKADTLFLVTGDDYRLGVFQIFGIMDHRTFRNINLCTGGW